MRQVGRTFYRDRSAAQAPRCNRRHKRQAARFLGAAAAFSLTLSAICDTAFFLLESAHGGIVREVPNARGAESMRGAAMVAALQSARDRALRPW
jgi:hypothetical protein